MANLDLEKILKSLEVDAGIKSRANTNWSSANTRKLLGSSLNTGFTDQMELLVQNLNALGMNVKPRYNQGTNTLELDLIDAATGKQSQKPFKIALSNKAGQRNVGGHMVRNDWQAYFGLDGKGGRTARITDSVTYELMQINDKLAAGQNTAVLRAAQKKEIDAVVNGMRRIQKSVNAQTIVQSKRAQKEIDEALRDVAKKSASRMAMDNGVMSIAPIIDAIAKNRDKYFNGKMFTDPALKGSYAQRRSAIDRDIHNILGVLSSSKGKNAATVRNNLIGKYKGRYGKGIETILDLVSPLVNYGLETTNISNGTYAGDRFGTVSSGQAGRYFSVRSNVHYRQSGNYNPKQSKVAMNEAVKRITSFNPVASAKERAMGFTGDKSEEKLMRYIEVSRQDYEAAQQKYIEHEIEAEYKKALAKKGSGELTAAQKKALRDETSAMVKQRAKSVLATIGEDSYGLTAAGRLFLDDYFEKNMTIPLAKIREVQRKSEAKGQMLSEQEAARRIIAAKTAHKLGVSTKKARKMIDPNFLQEDATLRTANTANYTYHRNRNFIRNSKLLGGQGDRATTVDAQELMLVATALESGIDPREIGDFGGGAASLDNYVKGSLKIGGVRLQRNLNSRNFEEWFSPRFHSLSARAHSMGKAGDFANDFNSILRNALGAKYQKAMGGRDFFTSNPKLNTITRLYDGSVLDLLTAAYGAKPSQAKQQALNSILTNFGNTMLTNSGYGFFSTEQKFFKPGTEGLDVNRDLDKRIVLASAFNAIAKDPYGHPNAKGNVFLDRRARYALRRDIEEASKTGADFDLYRSAIAAQEENTDLSKDVWEARKQEFREIQSLATGQVKPRASATHFKDSEMEKFDAGLYDDAVNGLVRKENFLQTPVGQMWLAAQKYKEENGSLNGFQAVLDMSRTFLASDDEGNRYSGQSLAIPTSLFDNIKVKRLAKGDKTEGNLDVMVGLPGYVNQLNRLARDGYDLSLAAATDEHVAGLYNDLVGEYLESIRSDLFGKEGSSYRGVQRSRWGRSGYFEATKANGFAPGAASSAVLKQIGTTDAVTNIADLGAMLALPKDASLEDLLAFRNMLLVDNERLFSGAAPEIAAANAKLRDLKVGDGDREALINQIKGLRANNIKGVTLEDEWFQGANGGLHALALRNPFTGGRDIKHTRLFASRDGVTRGNAILGTGVGWGINLDFDGDEFGLMLPFFERGLRGRSLDDVRKLYENEEYLRKVQERRSEYLAKKYKAGEEKDEAEGFGLKNQDLAIMVNENAQSVAEFAAKGNFAKTGVLDNFRQRMAYNLTDAFLDEGSNDPNKTISSLITRRVFESISQDAISAKKVLDRYKNASGSDKEAYDTFVGELDQLVTGIYDGSIFSEKGDDKRFVDRLTKMGIIDASKGLNSRYSSDLLSVIGSFGDSRKLFAEKYLKQTLSDDLYDPEKTSIEDYEKALTALVGDNIFTPQVLKAAVAEANTNLENAVKTGKIKLYGKSALAIGKAVTSSGSMPGHELDAAAAEIYGGAGGGSGSGSSADPMTKAADTLLQAAEALLKITEGFGGAGGSGSGGFGGSKDDGFVDYDKKISATRLAKILRPSEYSNSMSDQFVDSILQAIADPKKAGSNLGYKNEASLREGFKSWWATVRGTMVGNLAEMANDAENFGVAVRGKDGKILPVSDLIKNIDAFKPAKNIKRFNEWREELRSKATGGNVKNFITKWDEFQTVLGALGDARLAKFVSGPGIENKNINGINAYIGAAIAGQDEQIGKTLRAFKLRNGLVGKITDLGTEVGLSAPVGRGYTFDAFFDTLKLIESEEKDEAGKTHKHKAFATVDLKKLLSGVPKDEQLVQMTAYQMVLDQLTASVKDAWKGAEDNLASAYSTFSQTKMGKQLGWTKSQFAATKGLDSSALVAMSVLDEQNVGSSYYSLATGAQKKVIQEAIMNSLQQGKPLDDAQMAMIANTSFRGVGAENMSISDFVVAKQREALLDTNGAGLSSILKKRIGLNAKMDQNKAMMASGFLTATETEYLEKQNKALEEQISLLEKRREEMLKTAKDAGIAGDEILEMEQKISQGLSGYKDEKNAESKVTLERFFDRKNKERKREYKSLIEQYNNLAATYNEDDLAMNKTSNELERRAHQLRKDDLNEQMQDLREMIEEKRQGLAIKDAERIEADSAKKFDLKMDTLLVRNKGITNLWESLSSGFHNMMARFTQMGLAYSILNKLKQGLAQVTQNVKSLDKVMTNLRIVTSYSREDAHGLISDYANLATQLASTTTEVATSAQEWLRQGYQVSEVNELVASSVQLSVLGMMSASDATKALTSAMKGFKMEASQVNEIVDKFTTLDMSAATTAGDIATAVSQFAATAQMSGVNLDQAAAMATTIMDVSQKDAGATGNAIKTMLSRFGNVKAGTFAGMSEGDSDETTDKINDIERVLNTLGIQVRTSAREMRDFDDVLADIAEKWDHLDKVSQNAIATALAGTRQRESFAVLMNNYDKYQEYLNVSETSEGTAEKKYASYLESLEASQKKIQAAWEDFANNSGFAEFLTGVNNTVADLVKNWLPGLFKWATKILLTLNAYKIPVFAKAFFGLNGRGHALASGATKQGFDAKVRKAWLSPEEVLGKTGQKLALKHAKEPIGSEDELATSASGASNALNNLAEAATKTAAAETKKGDAVEQNTVSEKQNTKANLDDAESEKKDERANLEHAKATEKATKSGKLGFFAPTKSGAFTAAAGAVFSVAGGFASKAQGFNKFTGQMQEASDAANGVATTVSALSNVGYLWGPMIGMLTSSLADVLNRFLFIPLIDREDNERKWRVETANKLFESLGKLEENTSKLDDFIKKVDYTNQEELDDLISSIIQQIYSEEYDSDARALLFENVKKTLSGFGVDDKVLQGFNSIYDVLTYISTAEDDMREILIQGLNISISEQKEEQRLAAQESAEKTRQDKRTKVIRWLREDVTNDSARFYANQGAKAAGIYDDGWGTVDSNSSTAKLIEALEEGARRLQKSYADGYMPEGEYVAAQREINERLDILNDIYAEEKKLSDESNKQTALLAVSRARTSIGSTTRFLTDVSLDYLKFLGKEGIYEIIADELVKSGVNAYIGGDKANGLTSYAEKLIQQAVSSNSNLSAVISGNGFTLEDIRLDNRRYDWANRAQEREQILQDFASAMGISVTDLEDQLQNGGSDYSKYWMLTLGDFMKSASEVRQELESLTTTFNSLSDGVVSTAKGLEEIVSSFPSLIKYIGDNGELRDHLVEAIVQKYNLYADSLFDEIMSMTEVGTTFRNDIYKNTALTDEEVRALQASAFGEATNLLQISEFLQLGPAGIAKTLDVTEERAREIFEILTDEYRDYFDELDISKIFGRQMADDVVIPYLEARLDREIKGLNEQKEALQQINKQREYENKLIEARNRLEEAGKEKKRVWREGVGWVYEADQNALAEAQKNLEEVSNERAIRELDIQIEQVQATKELIETIKDDIKFGELTDDVTALIGSDASGTGINGLVKAMEQMYNGSTGALVDLFGEDSPIVKAMNGLEDIMSGKGEGSLKANYQSTDVAQLTSLAANGDAGAVEELSRRGYTSLGGGLYNYDVSAAGTGSAGIDNLKEAYASGNVSASSKQNIEAEMAKRGYVKGKDGGWKESPRAFKFGNGSYAYDSDGELRAGSLAYDHIQSDLESGGSENGYFYPEDELADFSSTNKDHEINGDKFTEDYDNSLYKFLKGYSGFNEDGVLIGSGENSKPGNADFDFGYVHNRRLYPISKAAAGSLSMPGGLSLINELGTEAVVTPYGTVTALPSGSGVVPADVTKNLWELGETAPRLLRLLDPIIGKRTLEDLGGGDSTTIQSMTINMNPGAGFNVDRFLTEVKQAIALKKNS